MKTEAALVTIALMLTTPFALCLNAPLASAAITEFASVTGEPAAVPIAPERTGA